LKRVLDVFERQRVSQAEGADLLAAQAYATGRFDLAAQLASYESTPLSAWVKGKLALRRGDRQTALSSLSEAVKGLPAHQAERRRAMAETGVLHLSSGDFAQAMELFNGAVVDGSNEEYGGADYWADLAYLAERVVTLDELPPLVDRLAPPLSAAELDAIKKASAGPEGQWRRESPAEQLRELAARRLMRAGRYEEALRYFDADEKLRSRAKEYADAMTTARQAGRQGTRAEAWFTAATIARADGMEILGYELAPDYAIHDGAYAFFPPKPIDLVASSQGSGVSAATPAERQRVEASTPAIDSRFHYRLTAVDHALASAGALPPRSQAFAAILCRATSWIIDREPKRAAEVYARYLKEGPYVSWAADFGRKCPEPDFAGAERRRWHERLATVTWIYTRHPIRTIGGVALLAVAGIAWLASRKMRTSRRLA
jgi:tetratricopeptide (TPR) repeat protein